MSLKNDQTLDTLSDDEQGPYGSLVNTAEFVKSPQALPPAALLDPPQTPPTSLPSSKLLDNLPAVATQGTPTKLGSPGSCEAQAFAYGLGSYTAARNPDGTIKWDPQYPEYQVSAAFMYRWVLSKMPSECPKASLVIPYLNHLVANGSPSAQDVQYKPDCTYLNSINLNPTFPDMEQFMLGSFAAFQVSEETMPLLKQFLLNNQAVGFSGRVLKGYADPTLDHQVLYGTELNPNGHGQLLVGYGDQVGDPAKRLGAFRVQNSFGQGWPLQAPGGLIWMSYQSFLAAQKLAAVAYPRNLQPSGTLLTADNAQAPAAYIARSYQWAPDDENVYLILWHEFASPISLSSVALTEPGTGGQTATGVYGYNISTGYTYLKRSDGKQFLSGNYEVTLEGTVTGQAVNYTGTVSVDVSQPFQPAAAAMAEPIWGTTGAQVTFG